MRYLDSHLSDEQLLLEVEGELSAQEAKHVRAHLDRCWKCRARRQEMERTIAGFVQVYQRTFHAKLPPVAAPRALLKVRLDKLSAANRNVQTPWFPVLRKGVWTAAAAAVLLVAVISTRAGFQSRSRPQNFIVSTPDSKLTPGAAILRDRQSVCAVTNTNNKAVSAPLRKAVFEEYGLAQAEPRDYEVDYLVTPALGGADDIRNLWPQSYSATAWNAQAKDALELRLREMVCNGSLDLTEAQHEIANDWIATYKKYFHTGSPVGPR